MHPAREVGGDFYDYFLIDANRLAFTIADVSGKGIPAALFMAVSRTVMRGISGRSDLSAGMTEANRLLATHNTACMFVTLFYGVLDLDERDAALLQCRSQPALSAARGRRPLVTQSHRDPARR